METKAVITGDIVSSRSILDKDILVLTLKKVFKDIENIFLFKNRFELYRGDSFQALLVNPKNALRVALLIQLGLRKQSPTGNFWEARIGIGIGGVSFINDDIKISNGEAFELSGDAIDSIRKSDNRIRVGVSSHSINDQLKVLSVLSDAIVRRWSKKSAEVIYRQLLYKETQNEIADKLGISQSAVQQRMSAADFDAINVYIRYFEGLMDKNQKEK